MIAAHELVASLADAMRWPRSRPARLLAGDRAALVEQAALCPTDAAVDEVDAALARLAVVLAAPPASGSTVARGGRRSYDMFEEAAPRPIIEASELLAGGDGGFDERLAEAFGLVDAAPLQPVDRDELKFVGFVPADALERVRAAVFSAGAGTIGEYSECSWSTEGTGTFRGGDATNPAVGERGEFEQVAEVRFETVCPVERRDAVCAAFVRAHPYEEPAYDVYALRTPARVGLGRIGTASPADVGERARALYTGMIDVVPGGGRGSQVAVTSGPLTTVLAAVLNHSDVAAVACTGASAAERELLAERGISLVVLERAAVTTRFGEAVAGVLSRRAKLPIRFVSPLAFPAEQAQMPTIASGSDGTWRLYFDGGSRGNPGPAAAAWVLYDPAGGEVERWNQALGTTTNNVAEYTGLTSGLRRAHELGVSQLEVFGDSELIVKQVNGEYKVKHPDMQRLHAEATGLLRDIGSVTVQHVYRTDNAVADSLVNEALDQAQEARS